MSQSLHESDELLREAAEALFRLGRLFNKIGVPAARAGSTSRAVELSRILVVQAIEAVQARAEQEVTVGVVAQQLVIESSTASRLVADAVKDGYVRRTMSPGDNRRVQLALTEQGHTLARDVRAYQVDVFRQVTSTWADAERREFARLFLAFVEAVTISVQDQTAPVMSEQHKSE